MSRVQLARRAADLEAPVAFYSKLLGTGPAKRRPGYANLATVGPPSSSSCPKTPPAPRSCAPAPARPSP